MIIKQSTNKTLQYEGRHQWDIKEIKLHKHQTNKDSFKTLSTIILCFKVNIRKKPKILCKLMKLPSSKDLAFYTKYIGFYKDKNTVEIEQTEPCI